MGRQNTCPDVGPGDGKGSGPGVKRGILALSYTAREPTSRSPSMRLSLPTVLLACLITTYLHESAFDCRRPTIVREEHSVLSPAAAAAAWSRPLLRERVISYAPALDHCASTSRHCHPFRAVSPRDTNCDCDSQRGSSRHPHTNSLC